MGEGKVELTREATKLVSNEGLPPSRGDLEEGGEEEVMWMDSADVEASFEVWSLDFTVRESRLYGSLVWMGMDEGGRFFFEEEEGAKENFDLRERMEGREDLEEDTGEEAREGREDWDSMEGRGKKDMAREGEGGLGELGGRGQGGRTRP